MEKPGFGYKLPDMTSVKSRVDRARNFPEGEFVVEIYKLRPKVTRANALAVIGEFRVVEIVHQEPTNDKKTGQVMPAVVVGERVDHYMEFGGQYVYGEQEWASLLDALGVPLEERNQVQEAFLGEDNLACGQRVRIRRQPPKTYFNAVKKAASAA